ncbi:MAG: DUF4442 domain-containing protein [Deltaproteobacteria bacterium]|nr:DUF4442 domain-containing protein [Deltaproteobacteria bacterium]
MTNWKATWKLWVFGFFKIPLLFFVKPRVVCETTEEVEIKIPLKRRTRNHLGVMYIGALVVGADCAAGLMALNEAEKSGEKIALLFKDFKANFLKRAESDVHFICRDGEKIRQQVQEAIQSKQRINLPVHVTATTPKISGEEPVAIFELTLSLKKCRGKVA